MNTNNNYPIYRGEDEPKSKEVIWIHHSKYKDLSSPIVTQVYSQGKWRDIKDVDPEYEAQLWEAGSGENSIQQKGTDAVATSEASIAMGVATHSGTKGFRWTSWDKASLTFTLEKALSKAISNNAWLSIVNDSHYDKCCQVDGNISVGSTTIKVKTSPFDTKASGDTGYDAYTIMVVDDPTIGDIDLGQTAHAEGGNTKALQMFSHAEGYGTEALGQYSHAEGRENKAVYAAHAEGRGTEAIGSYSHTEGRGTIAEGVVSHAEGDETKAKGAYSHTEGSSTETNNAYEHAEGRLNKSNKASDTYGNARNTQHSVGIGLGSRQNAFEIMQNGDVYVFGLGSYNGTNAGAAGVQTLQQLLGGGIVLDQSATVVSENVYAILSLVDEVPLSINVLIKRVGPNYTQLNPVVDIIKYPDNILIRFIRTDTSYCKINFWKINDGTAQTPYSISKSTKTIQYVD